MLIDPSVPTVAGYPTAAKKLSLDFLPPGSPPDSTQGALSLLQSTSSQR